RDSDAMLAMSQLGQSRHFARRCTTSGLLQLADMCWTGLASQFPAQGGSRSRPTVPMFSRQTRADLNGHQVKRKSWNPCGLAAILWRSDRFAILVFFASILVGAADVEGGALSWAAAWRASGCCGMSGTDVGT